MCWGTTGTDPGEFNIAHNIVTDADGWVYVADRENHRVQVFDGNGKYETQWNNMHRPCALYCCGGKNPQFIIGELGPGHAGQHASTPNIGPRLTIVDRKGKTDRPPRRRGRARARSPASSCRRTASRSTRKGDIYVGEVSYTNWPSTHPGVPVPKYLRSLQKLEKVT